MQQPPFVEPRATLVPAAEAAGRLAGLQAGLSARGLEAAVIAAVLVVAVLWRTANFPLA